MRIPLLFFTLATLPPLAVAEDDSFQLGIVEVSGGANQALAVDKDVISAEDINRHNHNDVATALNQLPGISIQNLGARSERMIYLRGYNSRQVPLFMDGIPVYVPYDGNVDLNRFTTYDIGQIDVSKGNASVLYGPNTLGGSINLISRRPVKEFEGNIKVGMGMDSQFDDNFYQTALNFGSNQGWGYIQGGFSFQDRQFWRLSEDFNPVAAEDGGVRENSGNTDYKGSVKLGLTPNDTDEYAIGYNSQNGQKDTPPYAGTDRDVQTRYWRWPYWDKESVFFVSRTQIAPHHTIKLRGYHDTFKNRLMSFNDANYNRITQGFAFDSQYDDYTFGSGIEYNTTFLPKHDIKFGFNYKQDVHREVDNQATANIVNTRPISPQERSADEYFSYALEDSYTPTDKLRFVAGASYERQNRLQAENWTGSRMENFPLNNKDAYNAQGAAYYELVEDFVLHASLAHKTRFPTIKDRYSFRFQTALPNPYLAAEQALNYELGFNGKAFNFWDYGAAVFFNQIDDAIAEVTLDRNFCLAQGRNANCFQQQNIGQQENLGIELTSTLQFNDQWRFHANYTWLDRNNISNPQIMPMDTPKHKILTYLEYQPLAYLRLLASAEYNDRRYSNSTGTRVAQDFVTGNLKATFIANKQINAEFGVNNVADQNYAYEEGFYEQGRNYFANLNLRY